MIPKSSIFTGDVAQAFDGDELNNPNDITTTSSSDNDFYNDNNSTNYEQTQTTSQPTNNIINNDNNNNERVATSGTTSLTSSLRRLITITFRGRRDTSKSSSKKSSTDKRQPQKKNNNNNSKRGVLINLTANVTNSSSTSSSADHQNKTVVKSNVDRDYSIKSKQTASVNIDAHTPLIHGGNNKRKQFAKATSLSISSPIAISRGATRSLCSRNSEVGVQTDPSLFRHDNTLITSNINKRDYEVSSTTPRGSSASERERFCRRSSQPQQASQTSNTSGRLDSKNKSTTAISSIDKTTPTTTTNLGKRHSQTFKNSEKNTETTNKSIDNNYNMSITIKQGNMFNVSSQTPSTWKSTKTTSDVTTGSTNTIPSITTDKKNRNPTISIHADGKKMLECPLCIFPFTEDASPLLDGCEHRVCLSCMQRYILTEINQSTLKMTCPMCSEPIYPNTIKKILQNEKQYLKYESFMLRRVMACEPDARWCPAPDCSYVVLATGCASCPKLVCGRESCKTEFCYHCKQEWHPNQTCGAANLQRNKHQFIAYNIDELYEITESTTSANQQNGTSSGTDEVGGTLPKRKSSKSSQATNSFKTIKPDDIKECPVCGSRIIKMNDGSCNHMTCSICLTEFCWLCMKEISDLHYFSPSGCTFWGKKPWSRKKKLLWQLGMLIGAPICIILIAGIAVPAIVIGIPVWVGRKLHNRMQSKQFNRYKKNLIISGAVLLTFALTPFMTVVALSVGVPSLLGYVYGVVPLSLCRSSGGCLSGAPSLEDLQNNLRNGTNYIIPGIGGSSGSASGGHNTTNNNNITNINDLVKSNAKDGISVDTAMSNKLGGCDPSIGETSIYLSNISLETNSIGRVTNVERDDRESASNAALAGSIISGNNPAAANSGLFNDDGTSTRALAGSIISKESGNYTLVSAEVHTNNKNGIGSTGTAISTPMES